MTFECVQPVSTPGGQGGIGLVEGEGGGAGGSGGPGYMGEGAFDPNSGGGNCNVGISGCVGSGVQGPPTS